MRTLPIRLAPDEDLRRALEDMLAREGAQAAFVLAGIGSLRPAQIRLAGASDPVELGADWELLTLSGSIAPGASHLHAALSNDKGEVVGGHVAYGSLVRTTAEVLVCLLDGWTFSRLADTQTGYAELVIGKSLSVPSR
jgi:predicted DNA-binding protein with PD1-like motif